MAKSKIKTAFVCTECGADYPKWGGQCTACNAWNTLKEVKLADDSKQPPRRTTGYAGSLNEPRFLSEVESVETVRTLSGLGEFDRVLGGGFVPGSVVLTSGNPGSGKSTLLLQTLAYASTQQPVLYVSGEESLQQIAARARRLGLPLEHLRMLAETSVQRIIEVAEQEKPDVIVIDSIQVMFCEGIDSAPGGVSQVRECAALLTQYAKTQNTILLIVGHVTKDQSLAGPMTLSHIVDTQVMLSSMDDSRFRVLRATKNRFGAVNELGLFAMTEQGLKEVKNPSAMFLSRSEKPAPGSVVNVLWEGTRPILVEIQALVVDALHGNPRRLGVGLDPNRIAMLLAVLARHGDLFLADQDVFVNCVGGIRVSETSADLAVVLGLVSSFKNRPIAHDLFVFGEVGLSGEIRPVANGEIRIREAFKHGFKKAIVPKANAPKKIGKGGEVLGVADIAQAIEALG